MSIVSHLQLEEKTERRKKDKFRQPTIVAAGVLYFHRVGSQEEREQDFGGAEAEYFPFLPFWIALALCDGLCDNKCLYACWEERMSMLCRKQAGLPVWTENFSRIRVIEAQEATIYVFIMYSHATKNKSTISITLFGRPWPGSWTQNDWDPSLRNEFVPHPQTRDIFNKTFFFLNRIHISLTCSKRFSRTETPRASFSKSDSLLYRKLPSICYRSKALAQMDNVSFEV